MHTPKHTDDALALPADRLWRGERLQLAAEFAYRVMTTMYITLIFAPVGLFWVVHADLLRPPGVAVLLVAICTVGLLCVAVYAMCKHLLRGLLVWTDAKGDIILREVTDEETQAFIFYKPFASLL